MVYTNCLRRTPSRLLSVPGCRQLQQRSVLESAHATKPGTAAPISSLATASGFNSIRRFAGLRSFAPAGTTPATTRINNNNNNNTFGESSVSFVAIRSKHSSTQIKRIFKKNPAKRRIAAALKRYDESIDHPGVIPEPTIPPLFADPKILPNGWNVPMAGDGEGQKSDHPFRVVRTGNKPNNAVGFLPVYSEFR